MQGVFGGRMGIGEGKIILCITIYDHDERKHGRSLAVDVRLLSYLALGPLETDHRRDEKLIFGSVVRMTILR